MKEDIIYKLLREEEITIEVKRARTQHLIY